MSPDPNFHDGFINGLLVTDVDVRIFLQRWGRKNSRLS